MDDSELGVAWSYLEKSIDVAGLAASLTHSFAGGPVSVALAAAPIISLQPPGPAAPVGATPADQAHNDLVQGLVDSLHVSGVLAAGTGSKALVDGHVYRINDVLDRRTGLRLVKADPDRLTFVDSAGVTYVKSF